MVREVESHGTRVVAALLEGEPDYRRQRVNRLRHRVSVTRCCTGIENDLMGRLGLRLVGYCVHELLPVALYCAPWLVRQPSQLVSVAKLKDWLGSLRKCNEPSRAEPSQLRAKRANEPRAFRLALAVAQAAGVARFRANATLHLLTFPLPYGYFTSHTEPRGPCSYANGNLA